MFPFLAILNLIILSLTLGAQIFLRSFCVKWIKYIFCFSIFAVFSLLIYYSYQQYFVWLQNEPAKYLLPPYQSINYFIKYIGLRFFAPYIISLLVSVLFLFLAKYFNKKYDERFFNPEEIYIGALALFLSGHPGWLFYFVGLILIYLLFLCFYVFMFRVSSVRLSLYYWWLPLAIFVILMNNWLIKIEWWKLLKI